MGQPVIDIKDDRKKIRQNQMFSAITVMFYGGLTLCAIGIDGVAFYSGLGLGAAVHGLLLAHREGAW